MDFFGEVKEYNPKQRTYLIVFSFKHSNVNIQNGLASVILKEGASRFSLVGSDSNTLNDENYRLLLNKFLHTISLYNQELIYKIRKTSKSTLAMSHIFL